MTEPWLTIIGIGEDGVTGLPDASRSALDRAEIVFGGPRHLALAGVDGMSGKNGKPWPVPFDLAPVLACRGQKVVVLTSGDPFWFGAGGGLADRLEPGEWHCLPAPGVFSLAAARLGWRLEQTTCLGLHAADFARLHPHLVPGCRILATLRNGAAAAELAAWLTERGAGATRMAVMERLGGPHERVRQARANAFGLSDIQVPVAIALCGTDLPRGYGLPNVPGRPEDGFAHDGQITKSPIRALTLSALAPRRGSLLWDIGGGSGAVSVEWALAGGMACCIEPRADRLANIRANIETYGLQNLVRPVHGAAPEALSGLPEPDAVFVGGGATEALFETLWPVLPRDAKLVANAVTLETESLLTGLHARHGGRLTRIEIAEAAPLGRMRGWQPARPVVQWQVTI